MTLFFVKTPRAIRSFLQGEEASRPAKYPNRRVLASILA
jgi:hypothetical protein